MSNARPALAKKRTTKTEANRDAALNEGITVNLDGVDYTVRMGDLSSVDTMALRRATGFSFMGLMRAASADPDIDLIAALVWLSRRVDGEKLLDFDQVAQEIGYDAEIDLKDAGDDDEGDDSPEA